MPGHPVVEARRGTPAPGRRRPAGRRSVMRVRYDVIQRPAPPIDGRGDREARRSATRTPRRPAPRASVVGPGPSVRGAGRPSGQPARARPTPTTAGDQAGQQVDGAATPGRFSAASGRDRDQDDQQRGAVREPAPGQQPGDRGEHEHAEQHRADQDRLVVGAELRDRPLLERGRRQVDDRRADREHRRGRGLGERGDEVAGGDPHEGGQDAEAGVRESVPHGGGSEPSGAADGVRQDVGHAADSPMPSSCTTPSSGPVATITLDSPHNRNALSRQLVTELFEGLERADGRPRREGRAGRVGRPGLLLRRRPRPRRRTRRAWRRAAAGSSPPAADRRHRQAGRDPAARRGPRRRHRHRGRRPTS